MDKYNKKVIRIYHRNLNEVPFVLADISRHWIELSRQTGDSGTCVLGAGFLFKYQGIWYFLSPNSPYQGSLSWEPHVEVIKTLLINAGATEIDYDWGRMD